MTICWTYRGWLKRVKESLGLELCWERTAISKWVFWWCVRYVTDRDVDYAELHKFKESLEVDDYLFGYQIRFSLEPCAKRSLAPKKSPGVVVKFQKKDVKKDLT